MRDSRLKDPTKALAVSLVCMENKNFSADISVMSCQRHKKDIY